MVTWIFTLCMENTHCVNQLGESPCAEFAPEHMTAIDPSIPSFIHTFIPSLLHSSIPAFLHSFRNSVIVVIVVIIDYGYAIVTEPQQAAVAQSDRVADGIAYAGVESQELLQPIDRFIDRWIDQYMDGLIDRSIDQWMDASMDKSIHCLIARTIDRWVNLSID